MVLRLPYIFRPLCVVIDPECGLYPDADATVLSQYSDATQPLAEKFPDQYLFAPAWAVHLLAASLWLKGQAQRLVWRLGFQVEGGSAGAVGAMERMRHLR